ncbi:MAG: YdhR family protein [candidate division Zixibacteria bacterium]|nr:YdhR family protein [candidate division Zixibacteria bacterium]
MAEKLLQINFKFSITKAEYEEAASSLAGTFAGVDGLRWKIWLLNEAENEAGGLYLFKDESSLDAFLNGPLAEQVKSHPAFGDMSAKPFDVMTEPTVTCRGPVGATARV